MLFYGLFINYCYSVADFPIVYEEQARISIIRLKVEIKAFKGLNYFSFSNLAALL